MTIFVSFPNINELVNGAYMVCKAKTLAVYNLRRKPQTLNDRREGFFGKKNDPDYTSSTARAERRIRSGTLHFKTGELSYIWGFSLRV